MSIEAMDWAKRQLCGSPSVKAVLVEIANWTNPDGRAEFRRVRDIASVVELSERNVQRIISKLETAKEQGGLGLLQRVPIFGQNGVQRANGFVLVGFSGRVTNCHPRPKTRGEGEGDRLSPSRVTDCHREGDAGVTGEGDAGVTPYLEHDLEKDNSPPTPRRGEASERNPISKDWNVPDIASLPPEIADLARQWPAGAYAAEGAAFHQHWRGRGTRRADWAAFWAARVQARHVEVMRAAKAGVVFDGPASAAGRPGGAALPERAPVAAKRRESERSAEVHGVLAERLGQRVWQQWFEPAALLFEADGLVVVAPSAFHAAQMETQHGPDLVDALNSLNIGVDWTRFTTEAAAGAAKTIRKKAGSARRG